MGGPVALLVLIVSAFVVNALLRGQNAQRFISGAVLLLVGLGLGPLLLGALDADELTLVRPAMQVAVCWLGLLFGLRVRRAEKLASPIGGGLALLLETLATAGAVALALHALVPRLAVTTFRPIPGTIFDPAVTARLAIELSVGSLTLLLGLIAAPSTPAVIHWARERLSAKGPVTDALAALLVRDSWVPLLGLAALIGVMPPPGNGAHELAASPARRRPWLAAPGAQLLLSVIVVMAFFLLTGGNADGDRETAWVALIGLVLIAAGVSSLLGLPGVSVAFFAGIGVSRLPRGRRFVAHVVGITERPVVLLLMLMAGLQLSYSPSAWLAAVFVLVLRFGIRLAVGPLLGPLLGTGPDVGLGLLASGGVTLAIAAQIELLFGGFIGQTALWTAAVLMVVSDLVSPRLLRLLLTRRGEVPLTAAAEVADSVPKAEEVAAS